MQHLLEVLNRLILFEQILAIENDPHFNGGDYYDSGNGGPLYGLEVTNPVCPKLMYGDDSSGYGTPNDPSVGKMATGVVVFGGGLALYDGTAILGALGVSGDTSCGDHNVAWRVRKALGLDKVPAGITADNNDAIIFDIGVLGKSSSGYGHPVSGLKEDKVAKDTGASADGK